MIVTATAAFREALPEGGRLAGLDVGTKTIGVALCDAGWHIASPAETIRRTKFAADRAILARLLEGQQAKGLVIGLPLNLDGSDSPRTQSTRAFARNVEALGLPILLWDERWSTAAVTRTLLEADTSRARRAQLVDKLAAAYILQGAIDALASSADNAIAASRRDREQAILAHVTRALGSGREHSTTSLGEVSPATAIKVREQTGVDISGHERVLHSGDIRHSINSHANPAVERARGQIAIRKTDFTRIPDIVEQAHTVRQIGHKGSRSGLRLNYIAGIDGYRFEYVELVQPNRLVSLKTMRKG